MTDTTPAIGEAEQQLREAMLTANMSQLNQLIHDDLLFNIPTGQTITKAADLDAYRQGHMKLTGLTFSDQQVSVTGNTAVVAVTVQMAGTFMNNPLDGRYSFLRVWKQSETGWQVIAGSSSAL